jgi:hypothetical protein
MTANKYRKAISFKNEYINIPIEIKFETLGREEMIETFQEQITKDLLTSIKDFDVTKFSHAEYTHQKIVLTQQQITLINPITGQQNIITISLPFPISVIETSINYEFNFYNNQSPVTASTSSNWAVDYENTGFNDNEIYYFANNFKGSFFKLDFYDTPTNQNQQIFLSIILPTQQGEKEPGFIGPPQNLKPAMVKKPKFKLDSQGADKEGYYIYWVKDKTLINLNEFYVSAKFFNAKNGQFIRMANTPQSQFIGISALNPNKEKNFYYKYILNYDTYEYQVFKQLGNSTQRVGTITEPIKWYEYVNP